MSTLESLLAHVRELYETGLPFNRVLGLKVDRLSATAAAAGFAMQASLVGNPAQETLHGGVISAVLDATGGLLATAGMMPRFVGRPFAEAADAIARLGTIDLRVDYLRPGRGERFHAGAVLMRAGRKVAVTRMELTNESERLIAVGTGTYLVG